MQSSSEFSQEYEPVRKHIFESLAIKLEHIRLGGEFIFLFRLIATAGTADSHPAMGYSLASSMPLDTESITKPRVDDINGDPIVGSYSAWLVSAYVTHT